MKEASYLDVRVFTVPDRWAWPSSVRDTTYYDKVVGLVDQNERDIWLPNEKSDYFYNGYYSDGYSKSDVHTDTVSMPKTMARRLINFFDTFLIHQQWYDKPQIVDNYDCHWFAAYLANHHNGRESTENCLDKAERVIQMGKLFDNRITKGQLGVIGLKTTDFIAVDHSIIALDDKKCIQAMGMHGPVAISPIEQTVQHYQEISDVFFEKDLGRSAVNSYGIYVK